MSDDPVWPEGISMRKYAKNIRSKIPCYFCKKPWTNELGNTYAFLIHGLMEIQSHNHCLSEYLLLQRKKKRREELRKQQKGEM